MTQISIISSLYKTEKFLPSWVKRIDRFANEMREKGLKFEIIAIANDPTHSELQQLQALQKRPWFRLHTTPREPLYATWNRGVGLAISNVCTFWNVDDERNTAAMADGLRLIQAGAEIVYFPFIYKRYLNLFGFDLLVKKLVIDPPAFSYERFTKEMHCGPFFMFTKKCFAKVGPFDSTFRIAGDYDWCVRAARIAKLEKSNVVAGTFEKRPGTLSGGRNLMQAEENHRVLEKNK